MSLTYQKLEPVEVRPPQMILSNKRDYAVVKGPRQTTLKQWTSTSISNSNIAFSLPPPSPDIVQDRRLMLYVPFRLTFTSTSTAAGQTLLSLNTDAPRQYPLLSAIDTLTCTINNSTVTVNMADIVQPLTKYHTCNNLKNKLYSTSFSYPDQSALYSQLNGSVRNPLAGYGDSTDENVQGRGGHVNYQVISQTVIVAGVPQPQPSTAAGQAMTSIVDMCCNEEMFCLSPFYWSEKDHSGFIHVNSMDLQVNFLNQASNRLWSRSELALPVTVSYIIGNQPGGPTAFTNTSGNQPYVLATYYTPRELDIIPRDMPVTYPFFECQRYPTDLGTINAGQQFNAVSNAIQLNTIPQKMYILIRERNQDLYSSPTHTDTFLQIQNINVTYQNTNGIFNSGNMMQLYQISRSNGCSLSWSQWSGQPMYSGTGSYSNTMTGVGSIFCAEFGKDIALSSDLDAPGKICNTNLTVNVIGQNTTPRNINCTMYLIMVLEGTFVIEGIGRASQNIGVLTSQDILDASKKPFFSWDDIQEVNGGDFFGSIKDFFVNKVLPVIKQSKIASNLAQLIPLAGPAISKSLRNLGYGDGEDQGGIVIDEHIPRDVGGVYSGGVPVGGRMLRRGAMRKRIML